MMNKNSTHGHGRKKSAQTREFDKLLKYIHNLADHKLGYPVSLLTYLGVIDNQSLGIHPGTLANVLLNNVGDPFIDSQTSLMEVKKHERKLIQLLEKYYGLKKGDARGYVTTGGTEGNFASLWWTKRYLINCAIDQLIETDNQIKLLTKQEQMLMAGLAKISTKAYQKRAHHLEKIIEIKNSIAEKKEISQQLLTPTVFFTKHSTHYSIPKIAEILRLNIRTVESKKDGSMDIDNLKRELILNLGAHPLSAVAVIANIGTTITGAIDDVPAIRKVLEEIKPTHHSIHLDGALTGFVMPLLKPFGEIKNYFEDLGVNTIVFSAHKYPGLSQPCGIILAQKHFFDKAFEKSQRNVDYVGNIRDVTITGSRSGLNVLMFYNALYTLGLNKKNKKLKKLLKENIDIAKYLYDKLVEVYGSHRVYYPNHFNISFPKPPMKLARKYQLMVTGETATICVLSNVSKDLIDKFINDLHLERSKTMKNNKSANRVKIVDLTEAYLKPTVQLFIRSFCESEPITKYLNISNRDYEPFATEVTKKAIQDGLSKVVLDENDKVIGFIIAEDLANALKPNFANYPKLEPIHALLEELSMPFLGGKKFHQGKVLHTWVAAIDENHRTQGLYREMSMAHVESAMKKGFQFIYSDFTNPYSETIVRQFEVLRLCNKLKLNHFTFNGSKPFAAVEGEATAYITPIGAGVTLDDLKNCYTLTEKTHR